MGFSYDVGRLTMHESTVIQETWTTVAVPLPGELLNAELTGSQSIILR